jgi:hypothetical protein
MKICHESILVRDIFSVNWTLFHTFDRNIECAIEYEYSLSCDAYCARIKGLTGCKDYTNMRVA